LINAILWFDRLLLRLRDARHSMEAALPGLADNRTIEIERELGEAEVLIVASEVVERLIADGEAPCDLAESFGLPFDTTFFVTDMPAKMPDEQGSGIRGILVSKTDGTYAVRAWFEERHPSAVPRHDFTFAPGEDLSGPNKGIVNLLYWLSAYVNAANLLAIRHNRRHDLVRERREAGVPVLTSYYTFAPAQERRKRPARRVSGQPKPRTAEVHGHFRRAHWHGLPAGRGKVWYPTAWVRGHRRRIPEPHPIRLAA
jgi:hypothetical protein